MTDQKVTRVILKKPDGGTMVIQDPDYVGYPDPSQPYWSVVKEKNEVRTTGEVWVEKSLSGSEVVCEDSAVCTGLRCFHRVPHERTGECGKFCAGEKVHNCTPYRISP